MLAKAPLGEVDHRGQRRVAGALGRAFEPQRELRGEAERSAAVDLEGGGWCRDRSAGAAERGGDRFRLAVGRVEREARPVDAGDDRLDAKRHAVEDLGDRVGVDRHLGGLRVEVERRPDDDRAEVEGPGDDRRDQHRRERGALVWAGEVGVPAGVEGVGARAGGRGQGPDPAGGRAGRGRRLGGAALVGRCCDRALVAVGDALERGGEALRHGHIDGAELLLTVLAGDAQYEGAGLAGATSIGCRR